MRIILASQSPRRQQFLKNYGVNFEVMPARGEEVINANHSHGEIVKSLAHQKAQEVFDATAGNRLVIGSDTIVVCGNEIMGKPKTNDEIVSMLTKLSGRAHYVYTGLCVLVEREGAVKQYLDHEAVEVHFCPIPKSIVHKYAQTEEPKDKAGAYAIQGIAGNFVTKIVGNPASIIGLPTEKLFNIFLKENIDMFNFD